MKPSSPDDPTPWSRGSIGLSDSCVEANRDDLVAGSSAPDDPTDHRVYSVEVFVSENLNGYVMWEGHRMNRCSEKSSIGSSDATFFSGR
jgi:hypothetical protein